MYPIGIRLEREFAYSHGWMSCLARSTTRPTEPAAVSHSTGVACSPSMVRSACGAVMKP